MLNRVYGKCRSYDIMQSYNVIPYNVINIINNIIFSADTENRIFKISIGGRGCGIEWDLGTVKPYSSIPLGKNVYWFFLMRRKALSTTAS